MNIDECESYLRALFGEIAAIPGEFGVTRYGKNIVNTIGFSTNLTPEVVESAIQKKVELIISHHDAWDFLFGMKDVCSDLL